MGDISLSMATRSTVPASIYTHCWREARIEKILTQKQTTKTLARARTRTSRSRIPLADQRQTAGNNLLGNFPYSKFNISHLTTGAMPSNGCKVTKSSAHTCLSFSSASRVLNFFCTSFIRRNAVFRLDAGG